VRGVLGGELDVGPRGGDQAGLGIGGGDGGDLAAGGLDEVAEAVLGDRGQEAGLVGEVSIGGAVVDADAAGGLAQRERLGADLADDRGGGVDEGTAEVAVVIGRAGTGGALARRGATDAGGAGPYVAPDGTCRSGWRMR
jgi:hypothetical protein